MSLTIFKGPKAQQTKVRDRILSFADCLCLKWTTPVSTSDIFWLNNVCLLYRKNAKSYRMENNFVTKHFGSLGVLPGVKPRWYDEQGTNYSMQCLFSPYIYPLCESLCSQISVTLEHALLTLTKIIISIYHLPFDLELPLQETNNKNSEGLVSMCKPHFSLIFLNPRSLILHFRLKQSNISNQLGLNQNLSSNFALQAKQIFIIATWMSSWWWENLKKEHFFFYL